MQRRWAAICVAFFLVTAAGAYTVMAVAEEPAIDVQGQTYDAGDTIQRGGTTYLVNQTGDGAWQLEYTRTVVEETTFANNTVVEFRNGSYNVSIASGDDPASFTLVEEFDVETILQNDPDVDNQTYTADDGTQFVRYRNGTTQPLDEYLPAPQRATFAEGDTIQHGDGTKTVDNVTSSQAVLVREVQPTQTIGLEAGETFTLGDTQYVTLSTQEGQVTLSSDVEGYNQALDAQERFHERLSGLLYVVVYSLAAGFLLVALAFLPHRGE